MKITLLLILLIPISLCFGQPNSEISTFDFVQIVNNNKAEAIHYYQNNWKVLRENAADKGYIQSYQLLEVPYSAEAPFHLILITTYRDQEQYDNRENNFSELIEEQGQLSLLNEKQPAEFRKTIYSKEKVRSL